MTTGAPRSLDDLLAADYDWTPRQKQVLDLIARGKTNTEIGEALGISKDGAKWHVGEILSKLGVDSREEAAEYWRACNGWRLRFTRLARAVTFGAGLKWLAGGAAAVAVVGVVGGAVVLLAADDDTPPVSSIDDPTATDATPVPLAAYPGSTRTSIPVIDAVIDAVLAKDVDALLAVTDISEFPCEAPRPVNPQPLMCRDGMAVGAPLRGIWVADVEGSLWDVERDPTLLATTIALERKLVAVYRRPAGEHEDGVFRRGSYAILFTGMGRYHEPGRGDFTVEEVDTFEVSEVGLLGIQLRSGHLELPTHDANDPRWILPPLGLTASDGAISQQWTFSVPESYLTTVAALGGLVVVAAAPEYPEFNVGARFVAMVDRDTGRERWRRELPCVPLQPALDDDRAYVACNDGTVRAWRHDGSPAWELDTGGAPFLVLPAGDLVIVADGDPDEGFWLGGVDPPRVPRATVRALDASTGALRWQVDAPDRSSLATLDGDVLYVATAGSTAEGEVLALAVPDGRVLWRKAGGWGTGLPAVGPNLLYVGLAGGLTALRKSDGEVAWTIADAPDWRPVVVGESVIAAGNSRYSIAAVALDDGKALWQVDYCDCDFHGAAFRGRLLVSGPALALLNPATGTLEWTAEIPTVAPPAIDGDWFFAPSRGGVTAFR